MPTNDEIQRIAVAMNAHRPDWPVASLVTFLGRHHGNRAYRALAVAGVVIATDPTTQTPQLLNQQGPWWSAAYAGSGDSSATTTPGPHQARCDVPGHEHEIHGHCRSCIADAQIAAEIAAESLPKPVDEWTPSAAAQAALATARAAIDHARRASGERGDEGA